MELEKEKSRGREKGSGRERVSSEEMGGGG